MRQCDSASANSSSWRDRREQVIPFFAYSPEIRKVICTMNAIESIQSQLRRVTRQRGAFPTPESAMNVLCLSVGSRSGGAVRSRTGSPRSLIGSPLEAGSYSVDWDGRDSQGKKVAAGIYFYRLEGPGFERTHKMVVLR